MSLAQVQGLLRREPRRWLITGCAGFIGSNLLEALLDLNQVVVGLDNFSTGSRHNIEDALARARGGGRFRLIDGDIRDRVVCAQACRDVDIVLHQAALGSVPRSIGDPALYHQVNVTGFVNMILAARDADVGRFVYASSSAVYGDHAGLPKREDLIGRPLSPYGLTKRENELYAQMMRVVYGLESVGLRYFNVFGRRQDPVSMYAAVIPHWVQSLLLGQPCTIFGDGETTRDFCYVDNIVQANLLAALLPQPEGEAVYNVGCGDSTSLNQLFGLIRDGLAPRRPELAQSATTHEDFRPGDVRHSQADIGRICAHLGYRPTHSIAEGLAETLEWYVAELDMKQRVAV